MSNVELITIAVSVVLSALTSVLASLYLKRVDFRNDYYKELLNKRFKAYESIEIIPITLRQVTNYNHITNEKMPAVTQQIFALGKDEFENFTIKFLNIISNNNLWLDDETSSKLQQLIFLLNRIDQIIKKTPDDKIFLIGMEYYKEISDLRFDIENSMKTGLSNLHDVKKVFKTKKINKSLTVKQ